ncbi:hypothetical protein PspLS_06269 [Pyricularia sp. CBS 133598]|nr:hypothetical protein PspLS_06269 [Pyricularia sp. CBS 133598]
MPPLLLLLCFVPISRILIRAYSLYCCLETESLNPTSLSRDSAAHIALAATATMVERGTKDKLWAEEGADVRVRGSAGNPLKRSALGSLDIFPSRLEDYHAFSHFLYAAQRHVRGAIAVSLKSRMWTAVLLTCSDGSGMSNKVHVATHFLHTTQIRLAPGKSIVFFQVEPVLKFDRRPLSEQQQVTALRQQHTSGNQVTKGPGAVGYLRIICAVHREHVTLFSLALGRLGSSVVCVGFDSVVVLAVVYLRH